MPETKSGKPNSEYRAGWDPKNVFNGTARYYARYRPGYPPKVIQTLGERFALNNESRVIDLGCGTGQIAIKLAPYVSEVIAIDPQEEMLEEGRKMAIRRNITNISWLTGESADLPSLMKPFREIALTVFARAFHWMDRKNTLKDIYNLTQPGGGIAIISDHGPLDGPKTAWKEAIQTIIKEWLGKERKAGTNGTYTHPRRRHEEVLRESQFKDIQTAIIKTQRIWSIDQIIGYIFSTSYASTPVLGDNKELFEADLRRKLAKLEPDEGFKERATTEIIMAWKR